MSNFILSSNMSLPIPVIGTEPGPDYASDINNSLTLIDSHTHAPGSGVQITPNAMDINADLTFNNHFLTDVAGVTLLAQGSIPGNSSIYQSGVDLYYVDGLGNNIQITQNGGVAGTPGSISNLTSPASASYIAISRKFVWQSDTNIAADMDFGAAIMRNISPNSTYALTLQPPANLASNFTLTLPTIPASKKMVTIDASGNIQADYGVDNSTITVVSNNLTVQGENIPNSEREHNWELNGIYSVLTYPLLNVDAVFFAPYDLNITSVWIYNGAPGTSGTTEVDLKVKSPGGTWASILSTTGKFTVASTPIALTSVSTTATATLADHGLSTGDTVVISGATQANYNGTFTVTVTSSSTFTYTMVGSAVSPATGSPVMKTPNNEIWTDSGSVVPTQVGVTKPVVSTSAITAGQAIKFDILQSMAGSPQDIRIRIYYKQQS